MDDTIDLELMQMGVDIVCYDPVVTPEIQDIKLTTSLEDAVKGAHCIVIATDHSAFKSLDLKSIARLANKPLAIVDGRHVLTPKEVEDAGITYLGIGRTKDSKLNIWDFKKVKRTESINQ